MSQSGALLNCSPPCFLRWDWSPNLQFTNSARLSYPVSACDLLVSSFPALRFQACRIVPSVLHVYWGPNSGFHTCMARSLPISQPQATLWKRPASQRVFLVIYLFIESACDTICETCVNYFCPLFNFISDNWSPPVPWKHSDLPHLCSNMQSYSPWSDCCHLCILVPKFLSTLSGHADDETPVLRMSAHLHADYGDRR